MLKRLLLLMHVVLTSFHKINLLHEIISGTFTCSVCSCCIALTPKTNNCYFLVRDQQEHAKMSLLELRPVIIEALPLSWKVIDRLHKAKTVRWVNNLKYRRQRLLTLPYMYNSRCGIPMVERPRNDVTYEKSWKCPQGKTRKSIHVLA